MKRLFTLANFIFFTIALSAEVRLPSILGDGMVLQQKSKTNLWGWAIIKLIPNILLLTENGI